MSAVVMLCFLPAVVGAETARRAAAPPETCIVDVEQGGSRLLIDLRLLVGRYRGSTMDSYMPLKRALTQLEAHGNRPETRACLAAYPRYQKRFQGFREHLQAEVADVRERLERICTQHTRFIISRHKPAVDSALAARRVAVAAQRAEELARALRTDPVVADCAPMAGEVQQLLGEFVPRLRNDAKVPEVQRNMARAYFFVAPAWSQARQALATSGKKLVGAPELFESEAGVKEYRENLELCLAYADSLKRLGAAADLALEPPEGTEAAPVGLERATSDCRQIQEGLSEVVAAVPAHNKQFREARRLLWERVNIKGWGMQSVYNGSGMPLAVVASPGGVSWYYRQGEGACLEHRFTGTGKHLGQRPASCPAAKPGDPAAAR